MKRFFKCLFVVFLFLFACLIVNDVSVSAKSSSDSVFEIKVGEEKLPIYYSLVDDNGVVKERMNFPVELIGKGEEGNSYRWEHTFCYKIEGYEEICEVDINGADQEDSVTILDNKSYSYTYFDEEMPFYSDSLVFEYVLFRNKFVDLKLNSEILLDEIKFLSNEIYYKYQFDVSVDVYDDYYVDYYSQGLFVNNAGSSLSLENSPTYKMINEVCVSENDCQKEEYEAVSGGAKITPYLGNITFYYNGSDYRDKGYTNVVYKTSLECLTNCNSRRVDDLKVVYEKEFYYDVISPFTDVNSSVISSFDSYKKSVNLKISVSDAGSGINNNSLRYYLGWNSNGSCSYTSEIFTYENGVSFDLGSNLKDGAICMYYVASDNIGNAYRSDTYYFYFDNNGPIMSLDNSYDSSKYYNNIVLEPIFSDAYSGVKKTYYLWSKEMIAESNYVTVKNNGSLFEDDIKFNLNNDGSYYLYIVAYDNLDNYKFYDVGVFNIDRVGLNVSDIAVNSEFVEGYNKSEGITINIVEMDNGEEFKCGFVSENVTVSDLFDTCINGSKVNLPNDLEGEYSFYVYVHDKANNYSLLKVVDNLKIDTKAPRVSYDVLYDNNEYRITNEITVNISDLNGVDSDNLKYGWFVSSKSNVLSSDLNSSFVNNGKIGYPRSKYGEYKLYVFAKDSLGNEIFISLDEVFKVDTDIIKINLVGDEKITILRGEKYVDLGARAYKGDVSSNRVSEVIVEGEVNNKKAGTYYITYSSGEGDLLVSVTRKVVVKSDVSYISISGSLFVVGVLVTSLRLFIRRKKEQNIQI